MIMRNLIFILLCTVMSFSCSSEQREEEVPLKEGQTVMLDVRFSVPQGGAEGRGGVVDEEGYPPAIYPINDIYLVGQTESGSYSSILLGLEKTSGGINLSSIPITTSKDEKNFYVTFNGASTSDFLTLAFPKRGDYAMQSQNIYFSSQKNTTIQMSKGTATPGGKDTYAPIGDILFKNHGDIIVSAMPDLGLAFINNVSLTQLKTLTFSMRRNTGVLSTKLIIVNPENSVDSSETYFIDSLGTSPKGWACRTYLEGFPLSFDMMKEETVSGTKGVVDLCDSWKKFEITGGSLTVGGVMTLFQGWGILDTSYPYIYSGSQSGMYVCFSIQAPNGVVKTLKVPSDIELTPNLHVIATAILYVGDLAKQFNGKAMDARSATIDNNEELLDIPYQFYWESEPLP
ncbi:hypothetical protein [Phocaeicola sp.]